MDNNQLEHRAFVSEVQSTFVVVTLEQSSACSGCHAAAACTSVDRRTRRVRVDNPGNSFQVGDEVILRGSYSMGNRAVLLAFLVPLILLLAGAAVATKGFGWSDVETIAFSIGIVAVYYIVLSLFRRRLGRRFRFTIEKVSSHI